MRVSGTAESGTRLLTVWATTVVESRKTAAAYPLPGARTARCHVLPPSDVRKVVVGACSEPNRAVPWFASPNEAEASLQALPGTVARAEAAGVVATGGARLGFR